MHVARFLHALVVLTHLQSLLGISLTSKLRQADDFVVHSSGHVQTWLQHQNVPLESTPATEQHSFGIGGANYIKNLYLRNEEFILLAGGGKLSLQHFNGQDDANRTSFHKEGSGLIDNEEETVVIINGEELLLQPRGSVQTSFSEPVRQVINGLSVIVMDNHGPPHNWMNHYYHVMEHLLGVWATLQTIGRKGDQVAQVTFTEIQKIDHVADDFLATLMAAAFPKAKFIGGTDFLAASRHGLVRMEAAITSNRLGCYKSWAKNSQESHSNLLLVCMHNSIRKTFPAFRERLHRYLDVSLRAKTWSFPVVRPYKLTAIHVARPFPSHRCLGPTFTKQLHKAFKNAGISLTDVRFDNMTHQQQLKIASGADVLVGLHGNGLTHVLWMKSPGIFIELYVWHAYTNDYQSLADVSGVRHMACVQGKGCWAGSPYVGRDDTNCTEKPGEHWWPKGRGSPQGEIEDDPVLALSIENKLRETLSSGRWPAWPNLCEEYVCHKAEYEPCHCQGLCGLTHHEA